MSADSSPHAPDLIWSKLQVPQARPEVILRRRLLDQLVGFTKPLVLVSAPAGYGKSTLLQQWAALDHRRFAWVSLDPPESDPVLFWRYVVTALRGVEPDFADEAYRALLGPAPSLLGSVVPRLLNALPAIEEPVVLVLDDYHRVDPAALDESLGMFVRHLPRSVTVALASRSRPPIPLADMYGRGLILEMGTPDLRLTREETAAAVARFRPEARGESVDQVHQAAEGWAAGVYLTSLIGADDLGPRRIHEYIAAEMLAGFSEEDRDFMRKTSILTELDPGLCAHVVGDNSSASRLRRLADANLLLLPLDDSGTCYRYHHLLQEFLQAELDASEDPDGVRSLHHKAYEWHSRRGNVSPTISHAIDAGAVDEAIALVCHHWYEHMMMGLLATAQLWISWFAESDLRTHPPILTAGANIHGFAGNVVEARRLARLANAAAYEGNPLDGSASFRSSVALMNAALVLDGPAHALEHAARAAELEPQESPYRPAIAAMQGVYRFMTGAKSGYYPLLIEGANAATGPPELAVYALANLGLIHAWRGEWEEAGHYAQEAMDMLEDEQADSLVMFGLAYSVAARAAIARGDTSQAERFLNVALRTEQEAPDSAPFDALVLRTSIAEALVDVGEYGEAGTQASRALQNLAAMGEGGIVERRLDLLIQRLNAPRDAPDRGGKTQGQMGLLLSTRERQVLSLLATGLSLEEIGSQLYLSRNTIKTYTRRTYRKLDAHNREQAVAVGYRLGLL